MGSTPKQNQVAMNAESYRDLHQSVIATIASFAAHSADSVELDNLRNAAPEIRQAIDQHPSLFNNARVLEIANVPSEWDAALNGVCYEPAATKDGDAPINFHGPEDYVPRTITMIKYSQSRRPSSGRLRLPSGRLRRRSSYWLAPFDFQICIGLPESNMMYQAEPLPVTNEDFEFKYGEWYHFTRKARLRNTHWVSYINQGGKFRVLWKGHEGELICEP